MSFTSTCSTPHSRAAGEELISCEFEPFSSYDFFFFRVDRLADLVPLTALLYRVYSQFKSLSPAPKAAVASLAVRLVELLYYRHDDVGEGGGYTRR